MWYWIKNLFTPKEQKDPHADIKPGNILIKKDRKKYYQTFNFFNNFL